MYFPNWNPHKSTLAKFSRDFKTRYKALRNSSSAFIKRNDVRAIILAKCQYKCVQCGVADTLQIDHIISVYLAARGKFELHKLNSYENLTVLCAKCNSSKCPN